MIEVTDTAPDINHNHQSAQCLAFQQEGRQNLVSVIAKLFGNLRKSISGQINEVTLCINLKKIDQLGTARCFAGFTQIFLLGQAINRTGFASIRTSRESDLGTFIGEQMREFERAGNEFGLSE